MSETAVPRVGDDVVLFAYLEPSPGPHQVFQVEVGKQLILRQGGKVQLPDNLKDEIGAELDLEEIAARIREEALRRGQTLICE